MPSLSSSALSSSASSSQDATVNWVMNAAMSANDKAIYCIVTPCECRMAIVILAMCSSHLIAAVTTTYATMDCRFGLFQHRDYESSPSYSICDTKFAVNGTIFPFMFRIKSELLTESFSPSLNRMLASIFIQKKKDISLCPRSPITWWATNRSAYIKDASFFPRSPMLREPIGSPLQQVPLWLVAALNLHIWGVKRYN